MRRWRAISWRSTRGNACRFCWINCCVRCCCRPSTRSARRASLSSGWSLVSYLAVLSDSASTTRAEITRHARRTATGCSLATSQRGAGWVVRAGRSRREDTPVKRTIQHRRRTSPGVGIDEEIQPHRRARKRLRPERVAIGVGRAQRRGRHPRGRAFERASTTDPRARLSRKGPGMEARLASLGHAPDGGPLRPDRR